MGSIQPLSFVRSALLTVGLLTLLCLQGVSGLTYNSTALVIANYENDGTQSTYILQSYGIGFDHITLQQNTSTPLPTLESSDVGNYGLLVVLNNANLNGTSLLTQDQWNTLFAYQQKYGVRMAQLEAVPDPTLFGVNALAACCDGNEEQYINLDTTVQANEFSTAGLRMANLTTVGLYHNPGQITSDNQSTTTSFMNFLPNANYNETTTAGVINDFGDGRQQMAIFVAPGNWSSTSTYFNHIWVHWGYRGLYQGYRRIYLSSQIDDLFLTTTVYNSSRAFRIRADDLSNHVDFTQKLNADLQATNPGTAYFTEFGFNANGNIVYSYDLATNESVSCPGPIFKYWSEPDTGLEYQKPLGSGKNQWPSNPKFVWTPQCVFIDPLARWFTNLSNRDAIGLVSHTFTHLDLDDSTYHDTLREISFNLNFAELMNFTNAHKFSGSGLIPPAITGMHNGDALRAFSDNGLWNVIGDNTRPVLRSNQNYHWPRLTDTTINGYGGYQITPRFSTRIYYNCDLEQCDLQQCVDTADCIKSQGMPGLLNLERKFSANWVLSLYHDPYMFHQPNLRQIDVTNSTINGINGQYSLLQMWLLTITNEIARLTEWPMLTLRHDDLAADFSRRLARDACTPYIQYNTSTSTGNSSQSQITSITVMAKGGHVSGSYSGNVTVSPGLANSCSVTIPVTIPQNVNFTILQPNNNGTMASIDSEITSGSFRLEQVGNDPQTLWVKLDGTPVTIYFTDGINQ